MPLLEVDFNVTPGWWRSARTDPERIGQAVALICTSERAVRVLATPGELRVTLAQVPEDVPVRALIHRAERLRERLESVGAPAPVAIPTDPAPPPESVLERPAVPPPPLLPSGVGPLPDPDQTHRYNIRQTINSEFDPDAFVRSALATLAPVCKRCGKSVPPGRAHRCGGQGG